MTSDDVYMVEGVYLDPHGLLRAVKMSSDDKEKEELLQSIRSAELHTHPLLSPLFVES